MIHNGKMLSKYAIDKLGLGTSLYYRFSLSAKLTGNNLNLFNLEQYKHYSKGSKSQK